MVVMPMYVLKSIGLSRGDFYESREDAKAAAAELNENEEVRRLMGYSVVEVDMLVVGDKIFALYDAGARFVQAKKKE